MSRIVIVKDEKQVRVVINYADMDGNLKKDFKEKKQWVKEAQIKFKHCETMACLSFSNWLLRGQRE